MMKIENYKMIDKDRYVFYDDGRIYSKWFNKFIDGCISNTGYLITSLKLIDGRSKLFSIHNVIAYLFCEIPKGIPFDELEVDHINTDRLDNRASNLRFTDSRGNSNNPLTKEHISLSQKGRKQSIETIQKRVSKNKGKKRTDEQKKNISRGKYKKIAQYTMDGIFIREWDSAKTISDTLGYSSGNISECCRGKRKSAYGCRFKYAE